MTIVGRHKWSMLYLLWLSMPASAQQAPFIEVVDNLDLNPQQSDALSTLQSLPTTGNIKLIRGLSATSLGSSDGVLMPLGSQPLLIQDSLREFRGKDLVAWYGKVRKGGEDTTLAVNGENVTGSIRAPDGLYRIRPLGNGLHVISKLDTEKLPPEHPPSFNETDSDRRDIIPFRRKLETDTSTTQISVLVAYTPAVKKKVFDVRGLVQLAFAETNVSYRNSGVYIELVPVPAEPVLVSYTEAGSQKADLAAFAKMDEIRRIRANSKSNIAVLLIDDPSGCGRAQQVLATKETAFAVVYHDCATGNFSFGHEIGHLQGARHNPEVDNLMSPFAYGHGFMDDVRNRRTIMSYPCPHYCDRSPQWARPTEWGNSTTSYDAKVLNETAIYISEFH